jgi:ketosteroid isomerase-like protein
MPDGKRANVIGTFEYSLNDDQGNPVSEKGKFFDLFEKQLDGTWLCSVAMWNSDLGGVG